MSENKPAGAYRKPIYELVEKIVGRVLTQEEDGRLHCLLIEYVSAKSDAITPNEPKKYIYECRDCRKIRRAEGKKQRQEVLKGTALGFIKATTKDTDHE